MAKQIKDIKQLKKVVDNIASDKKDLDDYNKFLENTKKKANSKE